jgi:hypothetical protein
MMATISTDPIDVNQVRERMGQIFELITPTHTGDFNIEFSALMGLAAMALCWNDRLEVLYANAQAIARAGATAMLNEYERLHGPNPEAN